MSDPRLISPMLDGFALGSSMSSHSGVSCYPAMRVDSDERYIVKTISIPASQVQLDALLLTGAYPDAEAARVYFQDLARDIRNEVEILDQLSQERGFVSCSKYQIVPMEEGVGYQVYLLSPYRRSLDRQMRREPLTQLSAVNMGIDLCAALAVCREKGYLYVDLKPGNIFITGPQQFRIGDLGFVALDSLRYASLPDRCRSSYIPPEISDAYATLNTTMDTYALGLVLYQVYNNGQLPFDSEQQRQDLMQRMAQGEPMPAPAYADYEMAEIILKACAFSPEERWSDPAEMGHALIAYMQRNEVNDVPIIPPPVEPPEEPEEESDGLQPEEDAGVDAAEEESAEGVPEEGTGELPEESGEDAEIQPEESDSDPVPEEDAEEEKDWIDRMDDILAEDGQKSSDPDEPSLRDLLQQDEDGAEEIDTAALSGETAEILNQAQDLIEHEAPEPAVAPEPIDIPMPEPIVLDEEFPEEPEDTVQDEAGEEDDDDADAPDAADEELPPEASEPPAPVRRKHRGIGKKIAKAMVVLAVLAGVAFGAWFAYFYYYLIPITLFEVSGRDDVLTVTVQTDRDESLITVVCKDNFGNVQRSALQNGKAVFEALTPGSQYLVSLETEGAHKLSGSIADCSYATPTRTQIASFSAITGPEDGSAVITFAVEGPDSETWTLHCIAEDEEEKTLEFSGHTATITGLSLGKTYTMYLSGDESVYLIGENQITFTSGEMVFAEDITVYGSDDGRLTVNWKAPAGISVETWTVHCYNEAGYDQFQEVNGTTAEFVDTMVSAAYTVEISAKGMSKSQIAYITANPVLITDLSVTPSAASVSVNWNYQGVAPENGWLVCYTVDGGSEQLTVRTDTPSAVISPVAPGSHYDITIATVDSTSVFGGTGSCDVPRITERFSGYQLSADTIYVTPYQVPAGENWTYASLGAESSVFAPGSNMALGYYTGEIYYFSSDEIASLFVIRDSEGRFSCLSSHTRTWDDMWENGHCADQVSALPTVPGSYTLEIYLNSMFLAEVPFTIQ